MSEWISVDEFKNEHDDVFCWISYKGRIALAVYMFGRFNFTVEGSDCYMTECISAVMPIEKPEPPKTEPTPELFEGTNEALDGLSIRSKL